VYDAKIKINSEKKTLSLANIQKNVKVIIKSACYSANKSSMVTVAENNPEKLFSFSP